MLSVFALKHIPKIYHYHAPSEEVDSIYRLLTLVKYIASNLTMTKFSYCRSLYFTVSNESVDYYVNTYLQRYIYTW